MRKGMRLVKIFTNSEAVSRREFLRGSVRYGLLGAIGFAISNLIGRRADAGRQTCVSDGICTRCPALDGCGVPQALSAKETLGRRHD